MSRTILSPGISLLARTACDWTTTEPALWKGSDTPQPHRLVPNSCLFLFPREEETAALDLPWRDAESPPCSAFPNPALGFLT